MSKQTKSQWNFGELFPQEATDQKSSGASDADSPAQFRRILSVSELTGTVRALLEQQVGQVWVTGEITNRRLQSSGHIYFTLKDASSQLSCVLFRGATIAHRELLQDGQKVLLQGSVTVYEARGQYQLTVQAVELQGVGALQMAFEKLKQKLQAEGLFAQERKRLLPRFPRRIGLVTSPTGAAIRDVLHVVRRRNPSLEIILAPCRVQGDGAAKEIAEAVKSLNRYSVLSAAGLTVQRDNDSTKLDLILVTRGGGSLEDLWAFNEEVVARAVFESAIPVVSAVGHEIDFTISDFVADFRAATPSAAAEIITEGVFASCEFVSEAASRMRQLAGRQLADKTYELARTKERLARAHPRRRLNDWSQRLDDLHAGLGRCTKKGLQQHGLASRNLVERLSRVRPVALLKQRSELFTQERLRLREQVKHGLRERQKALAALAGRLRLLGPEQVLGRGYSITTDAESGKVLRNAAKVKPGQKLKTRLKMGEVVSKAEK